MPLQVAHVDGEGGLTDPLTAEFCDTGTWLTTWTGLADQVAFVNGDALPFPDASFDLIVIQHSPTNIPDKGCLFRGVHRVLRSGGRLALHEIIVGPRSPVRFPVTWTRTPALRYLSAPTVLRPLLSAVGFTERAWRDMTGTPRAALLAPRPSREPSSPAPLGIHLLLGPDTAERQGHLVCNLTEGWIAIIQAVLEGA